MVKREEVEALLREMRDALCRQHQGTWAPSAAFVQDHAARIEELARTWLRVSDASVESVGEDARGVPVIVAHGFNYGDRVRLVPEADSGGDRG